MSEKICTIDGCSKKVIARGYCTTHYTRYNRFGDPNYKTLLTNTICIVDGCERKAKAKNFCLKHHRRYLNHGDPTKLTTENHGMSNTSEYHIWGGMIQRVSNPKTINYSLYGGRGITVCDRWRNSFMAFYEDMGKRPSSKHQIDRINSDGNYEPKNCRWITPAENNQNRRCTKISEEVVKVIRHMRDSGLRSKEISVRLNLSIDVVNGVVFNRTWKNIK